MGNPGNSLKVWDNEIEFTQSHNPVQKKKECIRSFIKWIREQNSSDLGC